MHIGILGTGFGKYHGELYKKIDSSINLTYWGRDEEKLKKIQHELNCDYTTDIDVFLDNSNFDFVDVCLPSQLHAEYALKALKKNHSVFLETPAVTSLEDGLAIMEAAKQSGKKVFVDKFLLSNPYYQMVHDFVMNNTYGTLKHLTIYRRTPPIWGKLGREQIATSLMIHDLDYAIWIAKSLKLVAFDVTSNTDDTSSVIDCLLSNDSLNIHVQGNSMLAMGSPFWIGYEATFQNASITYSEKSSESGLDTECYIYCEGKRENITFELEEHCKSLLSDVIRDINSDISSNLSLESALSALSIAFDLSTSHK